MNLGPPKADPKPHSRLDALEHAQSMLPFICLFACADDCTVALEVSADLNKCQTKLLPRHFMAPRNPSCESMCILLEIHRPILG